jgi:WD40 repeat protein
LSSHSEDRTTPEHAQDRGNGEYAVDARGAFGVQVGEGSFQANYTYNLLTWTDGVAPPPLVAASGAVDSPYRGLRSFEERDAPFFFGREEAATEVLGRMSRLLPGPGMLMVSGPSGAGKSSLLRAGVLPRLRGAGLAAAPGAAAWPCLIFAPGRAPLDELAVRVAPLAGADAADVRRGLGLDPGKFALTARQAALAQPAPRGPEPGNPVRQQPDASPRLLLIIDQFEQVFTRCEDHEERQAFIAALGAAASATRASEGGPAALVILGVRADFETQCTGYAGLADVVQDRYLVPAMTERQLRMAISGPAGKAGSQVDAELAETLLAEVRARQPGGSLAGLLPLLSHALDQAWRSRTGKALTLADYERTGGIEAAVATSAQRAYEQLAPGQQAVARQVFTRLTATSADGADTAVRVSTAELTGGKDPAQVTDVKTVLEAFAAERLITLGAETVEISHEALLTAWPLLRDTWLAETHADRIVRTGLHTAAAEWDRYSRDPSYLYRGTLLEAATEMMARAGSDPARNLPLGQLERDFLQASTHARRRATRWRRTAIIGLVSLTVSAIALAGVTIQDAASIASQHAVAVSRQLAAESLAVDPADPVTARRLALAAWQVSPTTTQASSAISALVDEQQKDGMLPVASPGVGVTGIAYSPDGKLLATVDGDGMVRLWNPATGLPAQVPLSAVRISGVDAVAFSPGGFLATAGENGNVRLWNPATGKPVDEVGSTLFGAQGRPLTLVKVRRQLVLRNLSTGRAVGSPIPLPPDVSLGGLALSPDGGLLAIGYVNTHGNGSLAVWNVQAGRIVRDVAPTDTAASPAVNGVAISPDGKLLASADDDGTAEVWNISTGRPLTAAISADTGPNGNVNAVAFSPDGLLATADSDGTVRLWNPVTGRPAGAPIPAGSGRDGRAAAVTFSGDGKLIATLDNTFYAGSIVRLWDPVTGQPFGRPIQEGGGASFDTIALSPGGRFLATIDEYRVLQAWDTSTGKPVGGPEAEAGSVAFSPDGKLLAASIGGVLRLWNPATGDPARMPPSAVHGGRLIAVAFTTAGTLLIAYSDGTVREWNPATGATVSVLLPPAAGRDIAADVFSPGGERLATIADSGRTRLWNLSTARSGGPSLPEAPGSDGDLNGVAFSPDDKLLAIAYANGTVQLWNPATDKPVGAPVPADTGTNATVEGVAFSPDGDLLASADDDRTAGGTVQLWKVPQMLNPRAALCAEVGPPTRAELGQYASGESIPIACA